MSRLSITAGDRSLAQREGLLSLSRLLVGAHQAGTFSESLEIVAQTLGAEACAAYEADADALALVAHRGLSLEQRAALERLSRGEEPTFIASRAARSRRIVVEQDVLGASTSPEVVAAFQGAGRLAGVAVPLACGRSVLGVLVLLHRRQDTFDAQGCAFLETAAGLITLARKAESAEPRVGSLRREEAHMGPLAMAGMLAAHFAGDVRGPLAAISLVLREEERVLAAAEAPGAVTPRLVPSLRQLITEAQLALKRAQAVTDQIVGAAQAGPKEKLLFVDLLRDAIDIVTPTAEGAGVALVSVVEGDGRVLGRRSELLPAFVAMINNAVQACQRGPRTRRPTVKITVEEDPRGVAVSIEDTGSGVAADIRSRIFEPFFSTNEGAAGIGLTLAKHAIVGHAGHLEIAMSPALGGALFRVVLPRAEIPKKQRRSSLSSATLRMVKPRPALIWIDRDDVFLAGVRRALDGFELRMAANAAEGEQLVLFGQPAPEIVFCELDLPDRSGLDVHALVARKNPDLASRFVFVTDGVLSPERAAYVLGSGCPTLVKPLDLDDIRALVQNASGGRESPASERVTDRHPPKIDDPFED